MLHASRRLRSFPLLLGYTVSFNFLVACAKPSVAPSTPVAAANGAEPNTPTATANQESAQATSAGLHPLLDNREPDAKGALPELSFKHLGMHIGGEANTQEAKRPFLSAIMSQEQQILSCYRWVDEPGRGGSFGVDLFVGRGGGAPEVRGVRTKLGGEDFVACMTRAFSTVHFAAPERPTVLSYSLLFVVES